VPHGGKIKREAFLYMDPKGGDEKNHAQCGTCMMWTGPKGNTCTIHGSQKVTGDMSCGLYVNGPPHTDMIGKEMDAVPAKESGLYKGDVRCENCEHAELNESECHLYEMLNNEMPKYFQLDTKIHPKGCCNSFMPATGFDKLRNKAAAMD